MQHGWRACAGAAGGAGGGGVVVRCLLSAGTRCPTKVASYGLVAHFPSCSPVAVVVVVAHVFEQRLIA